MTKRKRTKGQTMIYKTLHRKLKTEQYELSKNRGELMCYGRVGSSCSTCATSSVTLVTNGTYMWLFVTVIL